MIKKGVINQFMLEREFANNFYANNHNLALLKRFFFDKKTTTTTTSTTTTAKTTISSKHDAEEIREINLKTESRRMKAFKNYEGKS